MLYACLASLSYPKASLKTSCLETAPESKTLVPLTVVLVNESTITGNLPPSIRANYESGDVLSMAFLEATYITFTSTGLSRLQLSAISHLESLSPALILLDAANAL